MRRPEMILFDYGDTLLYVTEVDFRKAEREVFQYVTKNPKNITPEESADFGTELFGKFQGCRNLGFEIHEWQMLKCKYEFLGIEFSISLEEVEKIVWEHSSEVRKMPHIEELLQFLHENGIRTGVISNLGWSGKALRTGVVLR